MAVMRPRRTWDVEPRENRPPAHGVVHAAHVDHHVSRRSA